MTPLLVLAFLAAPDEPPAPKEIDYEAVLNERLGKGITPEKNANVLLWKAFGPTPEGGIGMPPEFFRRLGIPEPPKEGEYFVGTNTFIRERLKPEDPDAWKVFADEQTLASKRPWTARDYPNIAAWLAANEKPLAVVIEASKRPEYFNPLVSRRTEGQPSSLIGALLPGVQKCRELASALTARAMLRVGEGKFDEAWLDLMACHRLGRLLGRGATLIETLVSIAIDQIASTAEVAYLERANLTAKQAQDRLADLRRLTPIPPLADKLDVGERLMFLDCLQLVKRGGVGMLKGLSGGPGDAPTEKEKQALAMIDWKPAEENGNRWYDRLVAALRHKERADREKALDKIEEDLKALKLEVAAPENFAKLRFGEGKPDKEIGRVIGNVLIGLLMPAARKVQGSYDRAEQVQRNLFIAFALAAYRADHGRYPARLDDLVPRHLSAIPGDIFSTKPLTYRPMMDGYLLYSIGINGKDDEGRWFDDEPPGDDPRVRMPLPPLK